MVAVHCSRKSERDAGMPEMPEITRAEFDHQKLEAGHSSVAVGWVGVACHRIVQTDLTCLVLSGMEGRWPAAEKLSLSDVLDT